MRAGTEENVSVVGVHEVLNEWMLELPHLILATMIYSMKKDYEC